MGYIYKITSPSNKSYIGITIQRLSERMRGHKSSVKRYNGVLQKAILKYGFSSMKIEIIEENNDYEYLKNKEKELIVKYNTKVPFGYNMTDGGDGVIGVVITEEHRKNKRKAQQKSFENPERLKQQQEILEKNKKSINLINYLKSDKKKEKSREIMLKRWSITEQREKMINNRKGPRIKDGLTRTQRYRLKDLEGYRKKKAEYCRRKRAEKKLLID